MNNNDINSDKIKYLLPNKFRYFSFLFLFLGIVLFITRFYFGIKPEWLEFPVFAIHSKMLVTKYFAFFRNNMSEELVGIFFFIAAYLPVLTQEKIEKNSYFKLRMESFLLSIWVNFFFNLFGFLFIFGFCYLWFIIFNIYSIPIIYFCILRFRIFKN
jgi:hypothetical protein